MIAVRIPKEIREYKERILFGLTGRQLLSVMAMAGVGFVMFKYVRPSMSEDMFENVFACVLVPIGFLGFFPQKNGMSPEVWAKVILRFYVIVPRKRKFIVKNFFDFRNIKVD